MSSADLEPDVPADETAESQAEVEQDLGHLTVEDDPDGTVDPAELAGTAGDADEDVS